MTNWTACGAVTRPARSARAQGHFTAGSVINTARILMLTLLALALLWAAPTARAATYNVSTVAQLDAAVGSAQNGDTIQIAAGTYNLDQTLQPHNGVTLAGAGSSSTAGSSSNARSSSTAGLYKAAFAARGGGGGGGGGGSTSSTALDGGGSIAIILVNPSVSVSLNGLTLQHGEGDNISGSTQGSGGGVYNNNGTVSLTNCTLTGNTSSTGYGGAAVFNNSGTVTLTDCELTNNTVQGSNVVGGGAIINAGSLTLANCDFSGNAAIGHAAPGDTSGYSNGGAILSTALSSSQATPTLTATACTFSSNHADYGGAMDDNANSQATLTGCTFTQNQALFGAGFNNVDQATAALTGCTFTSNTATDGGGGLGNQHVLTLTGCTLTGNSATGSLSEGGGLDNEGGGSATLANCTFSGNSTHENNQQGDGGGGAIANGAGSTVTLTGSTLAGNSAGFHGGGFLNVDATAMLTSCTLSGNSGGIGGGFENRIDSHMTLTGCTLSGNSVFSTGGGGANGSTCTLSMTNCVLVANSAVNGGGLISGGQGTLTGCTFSGNSASNRGGGLEALENQTLTNCIFWGDRASKVDQGGGPEINFEGETLSASYCDIADNLSKDGITDGGNNMSADSQFVRAPGTNGSGDPGDLHLRASSPCLNRGNNQAPAYLPTDIQGVTRPIPPTLGAYEGYEIVVTNTNATGSGSLANAVSSANNQSGAVITFDPSVFGDSGQDMAQTISLNATLAFGNTVATIIGPAPGVILDGGSTYQIFSISSGAIIALQSLQIQHGHTTSFGGGIYNQGAVTLTDCVLASNSAASGGAIFSRDIAILTNCVLLGNTATYGGAVYNASNLTSGAGGVAALTECTLTGNSATNGGGVCNGSNSADYLTLTDDILYGDTATNGPEIYTFSAAVNAAFCDIKGGVTAAVADGGSNFSADPLFVTPYSSGATNFDLHVSPGSPAVGAGSTGGGVNYQSTDIALAPRANPPTVGAYEGQQLVTRTGLTSSLNPSVYGQSVTFTATVVNTATGTAPTGTVQFTANGTNIGGPVTVGTNGMAGVSTTTLPTGTVTIGAVYSGDGAHTGGSTTLTQTVLVSDTTALASNLNPSVYGQSVTFTAMVDTHGGPAPQGSVQFSANGTNIGGPVTVGTNGTASISTTALPTGTVTIGAAFTGSGFQSSTASLTQTVLVANMTALTSSLNPSVYSQSVTFTATVDTHGGPAPQGSVQFAVDGVNAGAPVPLTGTQASFATSALAVGGHTVTAAFTGSGFQSSSASLTQTVNLASVTGVSVDWGTQTAPLTSGTVLPWLGIKTLVVTLNAPAGLSPGDVSLTGTSGGSYSPVTVSAAGSVYTVTLAKPISTPDRLTLTVGNAGVNSYSTSFSVLPGDVNGDGAVNASDMTLVKNAIGGAYKQLDDIDGSGTVDAADYNAVRARVGTKLP